MPVAVKNVFARLSAYVKGFSAAQRTIAILAIAALVLGGIALASWLGKASYAPLFTGLAAADASSITDQLQTDGVPFQLTDGGATILVPQAQVYSERLKAASNGLPSSNEGGYSLLDKMGVTSSEFQQDVTYKRAMEGELAKTIGAMDGVQTATVQLAIPEKSVFVSEEKDPTASVFIATENGTQLSTDQVQAIVHLTSASVEGMQPTDVSVVDAKGQTLSAVGTGATGSGADQAADYDAATSKKIQDLLDTTLGVGNATVVVSGTMNQESGTRTSESYTSPTSGPVALNESSTTEEYGAGAGAGSGATGVLGPDNIAVPNGTATSGTGDDGYKNESATKNNAVDHTTETTQIPSGGLDRQTISVALNSKADAVQNANLQSINDLVSAAAGVDQNRGDQVKVAMMDFDTSASDQAAKALEAQQKADQQEALWSSIRTAGIVIGIVLAVIAIMFFVARRNRKQEREAVDLGELDAFAGETFQLPLAMDGVDDRATLGAGDAPTAVLSAMPGGDAPTEVLTTEEITAERRRQDISALAERDPKRTAELLRGLLDDRAPV
ncbi:MULTISPECIES: flagellar basal-body MS-ring/collar protein FliF [Curtobacterium]|jgi:flagellar M-ring protein FliF|uniref:flagellar basal-body MS-ring/collar protein FliF n=1 Tax=Curtobacterium TaxID=2034 RepID=UPI0008DCE0B2|nr:MULTISPECIES: flagellar basal-body MS-ring/collar protein FliF [Curtobacterium]MBT1633985.1 flagellar M-ring protein FliF [Curtobacterium flaccumfaciens pv. oortii]MCS5510984.1 flagellar basal-body MS-ring/collar protein FliF [Curtobacterium flaccumfaciens pv. flaccumfaciens]MCX2786933.1 flagellar basal-body MS-ring/collar protein FliF [Curtobacterium flaccumfaciens pv. flaccumfaciens]MCX2843671.1 flagellar basal-body MS-ring/collar protein FliF [Curtobacterium flaccumfaciens pv. oortii]OII